MEHGYRPVQFMKKIPIRYKYEIETVLKIFLLLFNVCPFHVPGNHCLEKK